MTLQTEQMFQEIQTQLAQLARNNIDLPGLRADLAGLKSDIAGVKVDSVNLKADMANVKADMAEIRINTALLKQGQNVISKDLARGSDHFDRLDKGTQELDSRVIILEHQAESNKSRWSMIANVVMTVINSVILAVLASIGFKR